MAHALDTTFYSYIYNDVPKNSFLARKHYIYIGIKQNRFSSKFNFYAVNPLFKWENDELSEIKDFINYNKVMQSITINITPKTINKIPAPKPVQVLNYYTYTQKTTNEIVTNSNEIVTNSNEINNLQETVNSLKERINLLENKFNTTQNEELNYLKYQIEYTTNNSIKELENKFKILETNYEKETNNLFSQITKLNSIIANINKEN